MLNRRSFFGLTASAGAGALLSGCQSSVPGISAGRSSNGKLRFAVIGTGCQGSYDIGCFAKHKRIDMCAFCDADLKQLEPHKAKFPKARFYQHWREMLDKEQPDAVLVATPDHLHFEIMSEVLKRGINLYAQKPLCRTFDENRRLRELAISSGVVTQLGTQIAAWECDRRSAACIEKGMIGEVKHVWLFSTRRPEPKPEFFAWPLKEDPVPKTLEWKLWLGPAKYRPYSEKVYHPFQWRRWRDFGSSWLGDLGIHLVSPIWLGLGLGEKGAEEVTAEVSEMDWTEAQRREFWPAMSHVTWKLPGVKATGMKSFEIEWFDGFGNAEFRIEPKFFPPAFLQDIAALTPMGELPPQGRVVEGSTGWLISTHYGPQPYIVDKKKGFRPVGRKVDSSVTPDMPGGGPAPSHYHEFVNACLQGGKTTSPFSKSAKMSEWCMTGNFSQLQPGKTLSVESLLAAELSRPTA